MAHQLIISTLYRIFTSWALHNPLIVKKMLNIIFHLLKEKFLSDESRGEVTSTFTLYRIFTIQLINYKLRALPGPYPMFRCFELITKAWIKHNSIPLIFKMMLNRIFHLLKWTVSLGLNPRGEVTSIITLYRIIYQSGLYPMLRCLSPIYHWTIQNNIIH